jgi:hypothetical protein
MAGVFCWLFPGILRGGKLLYTVRDIFKKLDRREQ